MLFANFGSEMCQGDVLNRLTVMTLVVLQLNIEMLFYLYKYFQILTKLELSVAYNISP